MLFSLLVSVALADLPPPPIERQSEPVIEKKLEPETMAPKVVELSTIEAELRVPAASDGPVKASELVSLVLSFHNTGTAAEKQAVSTKTVHLFGTKKNGARIQIIPLWSMAEVDLKPGALAAAFGSFQFDKGEWALELYWQPGGGDPEGEPDSTVTIVVE